ncbi:MAG: sigma-70 family RNA polymerase sigma factor [Calditrichia bacterium]|jgi:RNA polymerase sigma-70 factor (ECF subfamily)|nr:sigma-70 family RNA polymerase sigma factor [Calditrichia bacterium]MCK5454480.1 sigma-70 family RNA polymerase sigma factor [Calditrichia bacterium]NOQ97000.1 sigma-70 family RNA polymerase sigma factor [Calditrichia bacterium]
METGQVGYLVNQAKKGDQAAFTELVELYSERIYNLGLRILKNPDDAADMLQETFIAVYEKIDSFDGRSNFFTWLYRIATNFALMKLRKGKRTIYTDQDMEDQFDDPEKMQIHEWQDLPLQDMLNNEFRKHLDNAIDQLPEIYRSVFVIRDLENMSIKETSHILGITESNVKIRLKRARVYLREELAHYMDEFTRGIQS